RRAANQPGGRRPSPRPERRRPCVYAGRVLPDRPGRSRPDRRPGGRGGAARPVRGSGPRRRGPERDPRARHERPREPGRRADGRAHAQPGARAAGGRRPGADGRAAARSHRCGPGLPRSPPMTPRTLRVLEFSAVCERLAGLCASALGREAALALRPSPALAEAARGQRETSEARALAELANGLPVGGIRDIRDPVHRASIGGVLSIQDLLDVRDTAAAARTLKGFISARRAEVPQLAEIAGVLAVFPDLEQAIGEAIGADGEILEGASPALARIRRERRTADARLRTRLEEALRSPAIARMLRDPLITIRGERYTLPVRSEFRQQFPGVAHDQSSSGVTVFMEPLAAVPLGNRLRELAAEEREEVTRILASLSSAVGGAAEALALTLAGLAGLDLAAAKGRLSLEIGDEQSIAQNLSTFSSHLGAIVEILRALVQDPPGRARALVLLDEVGAGTDPAEGVALARALIEALHALGVCTAVTTHYNELKALPYTHPGMENASMEFDEATLRPTFRLLVGTPGRSNAFAIAERLGLDPRIVEQARRARSRQDTDLTQVLQSVEAEREAIAREREAMARERTDLAAERVRAAEEARRLEAERRRFFERAGAEVH